MARTLISPQLATRGTTGTDITAIAGNVDTVNGNYVNNTGKTCMLLKSGATVPVTFTFTPVVSPDGLTVSPLVITISVASHEVLTGGFSQDVYGTQLQVTSNQATSTIIPLG